MKLCKVCQEKADSGVGDEYFERALLDSLLFPTVDAKEAATVYLNVTPDAFSNRAMAAIYEAARAVFDETQNTRAIDEDAVVEQLRKTDKLCEANGAPYVSFFFDAGVSGVNSLHWAKAVIDQQRRRELGVVGGEARSCAQDPDTHVESAATAFADRLTELAHAGMHGNTKPVSDIAREEFALIGSRLQARKITKSDFYDIDRTIGGLYEGSVIVIAGRTSTGKTALALAISRNVAKTGGHVLVITAETPGRELLHRFVTMETGLPRTRLLGGEHALGGDCGRVVDTLAGEWLRRVELLDSPKPTVADVRSAVHEATGKHGHDLALVVIDYLQLIRPLKRDQNREREVAEISREMKGIALGFSVPVLCLAQLSRQADHADEPQLSHLRESGAIEQDADVVMMLQRGDDADTTVTVHVRKNRQTGKTGSRELRWDEGRSLFTNLSRGAE